MVDIFAAAGTVVEDEEDIFAAAGTVVEDEEDIFAAAGTVVDKDNTLSEDVQGAGQKLLDGLTFGFGDELAAGLRVGTDELVRTMFPDVVPTGTASERFDRYLNQGREAEQKFSKDNPITSAVLEIGAGLTTGVGVGRVVGTGATRLQNVARQGLTSAADITVYQIGESEGNIQERIANVDPAVTALGAAVGGIAGAFLRGQAEVPSEKLIKNRATARSTKSYSPSNIAVERGPMAIGKGVLESPVSKTKDLLESTYDSLAVRTKDWTAKNVDDRSAFNLINADGQSMRAIAKSIQDLDSAAGKSGSLGKLDSWFKKTVEGQKATKFLADSGKTGKYGVVDDPLTRQSNFKSAQDMFLNAPEGVKKTFDALNMEMRRLKDLDPGNKATGDFWPFRLKQGASDATVTGNYETPVASALSYLEDVRVAQLLAKNFGVSPYGTKGARSANDIRNTAIKLEKQGMPEAQITKKIEQLLKKNETSNTDRVIDTIVSSKKDLTEEQQANLREILVTTFVSGRKSSHAALDAIRVAVSTSLLARLSGSILNLSEVGVGATNFGLVNALKSLPQSIRSALLTNGDKIIDDFGNSLRMPDVGVVNQFMGEVRQTKGGLRDKLANALFTASGVKAINRLGQEVALNASLRQAIGAAKNNSLSKLKAAKGMTPQEIKLLSKELEAGNIRHPDVKDFVFRQITDVAPVSRTSMPKAYNDNPNGRVFYSMLSFLVQQHNLLRENVGSNLVNAYKQGLNTKAGQEHFKDAASYGARYAVFTAGLAGLFDDGRKVLRGDEDAEYDPISSTTNQLAQFATLGTVQPRAAQYGRKTFDPLAPPQLSAIRDVGSLAAETAMGEAEMEDFYKVMQRWFPGVSNLDDFFRYFNEGERLLTD
jgi:hypothetical protein